LDTHVDRSSRGGEREKLVVINSTHKLSSDGSVSPPELGRSPLKPGSDARVRGPDYKQRNLGRPSHQMATQ
jgi:hypothetical protein